MENEINVFLKDLHECFRKQLIVPDMAKPGALTAWCLLFNRLEQLMERKDNSGGYKTIE